MSLPIKAEEPLIFQAVELVRMERCPAQAVLPLVGLAARNHRRPV
ncbi:MAG: hypothetical protein ACQESR_25180 [Planctomycetota bacterium]